MAALQLEVSPHSFNVNPEGPEDEQFVARDDLPTGLPSRLESALPPELARRVVEDALSLSHPVRSRLTVETGGEQVTLSLPLEYAPEAQSGFRLQTPESSQGFEFLMDARPDGQVKINLSVRYASLPVGRALSYARFFYALHGEEGALYLTRLEPAELKLELLKLPLPLDSAMEDETGGMLRFLEALNEIGRATDTEFVYPSEIEDEDLNNVNHVLKAIRSGWVTQRVKDFATPLGPEGVKNLLDLVKEEGEVARAFYQTNEGEIFDVFGTSINLGPGRWYISDARLQTPRAEMEEWLASGSERGNSFEVRWVPVDGVLLHRFYPEWPKPSLDVALQNIEAFEDEYGMNSEEFRKAWEDGETNARGIEEGDIWISFLNARDALEPGS
jgi:hypothetical protein